MRNGRSNFLLSSVFVVSMSGCAMDTVDSADAVPSCGETGTDGSTPTDSCSDGMIPWADASIDSGPPDASPDADTRTCGWPPLECCAIDAGAGYCEAPTTCSYDGERWRCAWCIGPGC